jgi:hypothetical protein
MAWSFITNLGSEEILEDSEIVDLEFDDERLLLMKTESCEAAEGGCLVEHV